MHQSGKFALFALSGCIAVAVAGCGGTSSDGLLPSTPGGGVPPVTPGGVVPPVTPGGVVPPVTPGGDVPPVTPASNAVVISGVVATGGPVSDAAVSITDRTGKTVGSGRTDAAGNFSIGVNPLYERPLTVAASRVNTVGGNDTLVSVTDTTTSAIINVNPISTMIAALMSVSGNPSTLGAEIASGKVTIDEKVLLANRAKASAILAPLISVVKTSIDAVLNGPAPADGTGPDRLLDLIDILITKNNDGTSTIEITIKAASNGQQLPVIRFTNSTLLANILENNAITKNAVRSQTITEDILPRPGTSAQIADLLKRMSACFALPTASRVNDAGNGTGSVKAPECKSLFKSDDPAAYLHFGERVSATGAFSTLFSDTGTRTDFRQGTFEYMQNNGDIVFGMVSVDKNLVSRYEESVATMAPDGKLRLTGNQYAFAGSINPMAELHYFIDDSLGAYVSTGYNIKVPLQNANGQKVSRVEVTSPRGTKHVLVRGLNAMTLPKLTSDFTPELDDTGAPKPSGSAFLRLSSMLSSEALTDRRDIPRDMPYTLERNLYSAKQSETNETIAAYLPRGAWTFDYFTSAATTPIARQIVRTRARALTQSEANASAQLGLLSAYTLTEGSLASLRSRAYPQTNPPSALLFPLEGLRSLSYAWERPSTAAESPLPLVSTRVFGFVIDFLSPAGTINDFTESVDLTPAMRNATLPCSFNASPLHCDSGGNYSSEAWLDGIQLLSRDALGREFSSFASTWRLQP
ncbi:MAG: hypothetical protein ACJ8G3_09070 [Burkholderiaceae bacterium]